MFRSLATAFFAATLAFGAPARRQLSVNRYAGEVEQNSYIVKLRDGVSIESHRSSLPFSFSVTDDASPITHEYSVINGYAGTFSDEEVEALLLNEDVEYVEENGIMSINAEQTGAPWGLQSISSRTPVGGSDAGTLKYTYKYDEPAGQGVDVYVVDTGVFIEHSEFEGRATFGFAAGTYAKRDGHGHGTHCAGTVAGKTYGVAKGANIIGVKVLSDSGSGSVADIVAGLQYVVDSAAASGRPSIGSMSLGGGASTPMDDAVKAAIAAGIQFAIAAGNSNVNAANTSPARVAEAITVAASTITNAKASFSNFGPVIDIWAPGQNVISAWIGSTTATNNISGTSMATPHVAGLGAYLLGKNGSLSPAALLAQITSLGTTGVITGAPSGTVNLLAFNGIGSSTPTSSTTTSVPPSSTSATITSTSTTSTRTSTSSSSTTTKNNCPWWWPNCPWKDW